MRSRRACLALLLIVLAARAAPAATFVVTQTADDDGACDASCALREAILAAAVAAGPDDIVVPAGTYPLALGSLPVDSDVTIAGAGAATTVIDGQGTPTVVAVSGTVAIADLTIRNGALANQGGGVDNGGTLTLTRVVLRDNLVSIGITIGGGVYNHGTLLVRDSTITNNGATFGGGGILNEVGASLTLINTTISGNLSDGLFDAGRSTLVNTTIVGNSGDGLTRFGSGATRNSHLANAIISDNAFDCTGTAAGIVSDGFNAAGDATCAFAAVGVDPRLAPLGDYGGPTPTHALCTGAGVPDASCAGASPLIDAGNPAAPGSGGAACAAADQRAVARGQTRCDVGAYEAACGDQVVDAGETCDDGNLVDADGCDSNCTATACGNGILTPGEACDDGNDVATDGCTTACTVCGDGVVDAPETCDDMNLVSDDGCDANCTVTGCGNGVITGGEVCDDGNGDDADCCSNACQPAASGSDCADDGFACTSDRCDGAGGCVHALRSATVCRPAASPCDAAEQCDGTAPACPPDGVAPAGTECRTSAGACDPAEECDGVSPLCPPDAVFPAGVVCRVDQGDCDLAEQCTGSAAACPPDLKRTGPCRAASGVCDVAESCDGLSDVCPADEVVPDGTGCDDGAFCNGVAQCQQGQCAAAAAPCALVCDEEADACRSACPERPRSGCRTAQQSLLLIIDRAEDAGDRLVWTWRRGAATSALDFGDPTTTTDTVLCLYAGTAQALLPGGELIVPAGGSHWAPRGARGFTYRDRHAVAGARTAILKSGAARRAKASLSGRGAALPDPSVPLPSAHLPLVVQLMNSDTPACWQSTFAAGDVLHNRPGRFKARAE